MQAIDEVFDNNGLVKPETFNIKKISAQNSEVFNLTETIEDDKVDNLALNFIFDQICIKNENLILGKTIKCDCSKNLKKTMLCFELLENIELPEKLYTAILYRNDKELDLYIHHTSFKDFHNVTRIEEFPYVGNGNLSSRLITLLIKAKDSSPIDENLMTLLTAKDNVIFVHPDNSI